MRAATGLAIGFVAILAGAVGLYLGFRLGRRSLKRAASDRREHAGGSVVISATIPGRRPLRRSGTAP